MSDTLITVENISKKFCRSLKRSLWYGVKDLCTELAGRSNGHRNLQKHEFWALYNVSLELKRGETLGLIGSNGSGKTTLLRLINGLIKPDKGRIEVKGRVQALIALGAGFNPILSGRENIYINAAVLGIPKFEVDRKFDEIVDFSGIKEFIDAPVQSYSSGMIVRLGFSIAAHMQPDILLLDEVLAVGDLAFMYKCHRKMSDFRQQGGSVILVTHNLQAIRNMCNSVIWINNGEIREVGPVHEISDHYENQSIADEKSIHIGDKWNYDSSVELLNVEFLGKNDKTRDYYCSGDFLKIRIHFRFKRVIENPIFTISVHNREGILVSSNHSNFDNYKFPQIIGVGCVDYCIENLALTPGQYICTVYISDNEVSNMLERHEKMYTFNLFGNRKSYGIMNPSPKWIMGTSVIEIDSVVRD